MSNGFMRGEPRGVAADAYREALVQACKQVSIPLQAFGGGLFSTHIAHTPPIAYGFWSASHWATTVANGTAFPLTLNTKPQPEGDAAYIWFHSDWQVAFMVSSSLPDTLTQQSFWQAHPAPNAAVHSEVVWQMLQASSSLGDASSSSLVEALPHEMYNPTARSKETNNIASRIRFIAGSPRIRLGLRQRRGRFAAAKHDRRSFHADAAGSSRPFTIAVANLSFRQTVH
jgi:hypothetical protein